ncbi:MAG: fibronectin type III domain-containing protein [Betaproteobacteria bacterium]
MFRKLHRQAGVLLSILLLFSSAVSHAAFHIVQINEVYSNASGTVQFIEIQMLAAGQNQFAGQMITSAQGATTHSFTFPSALANANNGDTVLIATQSYAALPGVPAPDFIVPDNFIFTSNVTVNFAGVDFVTYATLPTDGVLSVNHAGATATNSPRNNARVTGTVAGSAPATAPAAPIIGAGSATGGTALINFTAGANGGSPVTGFTATCTASGQSTRTGTGASSPISVAQLTTGVAYSCSVTATNAIGTSAASGTVSVTSSAAVSTPGAPSITSAVAGDRQATIGFTAPNDNGGAAIISYTVTCGTVISSGPTSPITVTGLVNGTTYACTVAAVNSAGTGAQSVAASVTPAVVATPTPPTQVPNISLTSTIPGARYGELVKLVVTLTGNPLPTGTVTFNVSTSVPGIIALPGCVAVPLVAGTASCTAPGTYQNTNPRQYNVSYSGDANFQAAIASYQLSVVTTAATLSVNATPLPPVVGGRTAKLTALVKMTNPVGTVSFLENGAAITGCAQLPVTILPDLATDAAVASCTVTVQTGFTGNKPYGVNYFYPAGHASGRVLEQLAYNLSVVESAPLDYTDMWWVGPSENGWGVSITQHGGVQFNVIFAYDNAGKSIWYVMPGGTFTSGGTVLTGPLYLPTSAPFNAYDTSRFAANAPVGTATLTFTSASTATLAYTINGISGTKSIQRQIFGAETTGANLRINDLWWATIAENGWGMNIAQQGRTLFPVWYTYDTSGRASFFSAQGGSWTGTVWTGILFSHTSSAWLGVPYNPAAVGVTNVGTMSLDFTDANNATMTYTVNGVTQQKRIERQPY